MAEPKQGRRRQPRAKDSAEDRATRSRQKAEQEAGALDNPDIAGEPSEFRHVGYFVAVLVLAFGLNVLAMLVVSGGQ